MKKEREKENQKAVENPAKQNRKNKALPFFSVTSDAWIRRRKSCSGYSSATCPSWLLLLDRYNEVRSMFSLMHVLWWSLRIESSFASLDLHVSFCCCWPGMLSSCGVSGLCGAVVLFLLLAGLRCGGCISWFLLSEIWENPFIKKEVLHCMSMSAYFSKFHTITWNASLVC